MRLWFRVFVISYVPVALIYGGWNFHRDCKSSAQYRGDQYFCSFFHGWLWPIFMPTKATIWVLDPVRFPPSFPNIQIKVE